MKAALDSIKPEVFANLNKETIQHMKLQWQINKCFGIVERVVNTPHTSRPSSQFIFKPDISVETLTDAADREHAARMLAMVQSEEQVLRIKEK